MEILSRIGSVLGNPIYSDECTTRVDKISFARVLNEMDITVPLPLVIKVQDTAMRNFEQEVWYDWVPEYCEECLQVGHDYALRYEKTVHEPKAKQKTQKVPEPEDKQHAQHVKKIPNKYPVMEWKAKPDNALIILEDKGEKQQDGVKKRRFNFYELSANITTTRGYMA
ncbi:uncharacterized protein [Nicotiana tomentosiformis]|uniref:uncharacterized protein n=1 Tax=Nicotiana tomentosiformis TaxID=4098 RepID=UPI00051C249F|nr:uncharacterized protein LOC104104989 [Nicotiana tomentosiformis]